MNGRKSKALRRMAERLTEGKPKVAYRINKNPVEMEKTCTRYLYKKLKRAA